uniref:Uncharacterized protein n=1 Tax=Pyxicephalus adspersus TaxID=30357 RepID=A0AAV3APU6_PYXAD|nr:TPA: hypothetical protein GDO54_008891 [Pyxicephalus adspersus]
MVHELVGFSGKTTCLHCDLSLQIILVVQGVWILVQRLCFLIESCKRVLVGDWLISKELDMRDKESFVCLSMETSGLCRPDRKVCGPSSRSVFE